MTDFRNQGLTPGYWKNHVEVWDDAGWTANGKTLTPSLGFESLFGIGNFTFRDEGADGILSLQEALGNRGGGADALARSATAAILNASESSNPYFLWREEIVSAVQETFGGAGGTTYNATLGGRLNDILDYFNNLKGAELDTDNNPEGDPFGLVQLLHDPNWQTTIQDWIL